MQPDIHKSKSQKTIFLAILMLILLATGASAAYYFVQKDNEIKGIDSFEDCAAAHNPILESYPERCIAPDGRSFTKKY